MVKRYYIQDCPENFRGNTETRTIASDFIWPSVKRVTINAIAPNDPA